MSDVKIHVAEMTHKITGKTIEYHYVALADYQKSEADLLLARQRIAALEAVLRCCLADPRIPTDLWRIIEPALAAAETEVKP